ncbi:MAG: acyltransferase [Verrucomicrobiaceae bacterium]|nr:MAG: acyltransferase [Verrucomicrobiaceae bacterium]
MPPAKRNPVLDLLRGIAILVVILHHCEECTIPGIPSFSGVSGFVLWRFRFFGATGVDLFFVLSGFLVGGLLINEIDKYGTIYLSRFLMRRGLKIWPSYFALLTVLALTHVADWPDLSSLWGTVRSLGIHALFLQNYLDQTHNTPTWTLAVEEHFYIFLPLLLLVLKRFNAIGRIGHATVAVMLLCLVFRLLHLRFNYHINDFMLTHNRLGALMPGVFLAWAWKHHRDRIVELTGHRRLIFPVALILIAPSFFLARGDAFMFAVGFPMLTVGYAMILITLVAQGVGGFEHTRTGRAIRQVGLWSYNIYLWHFFLPLLLAPAYQPAQLWLSKLVPNPYITLTLQVAFFTVLSIAAGWFFTRFLEEPVLSLREKVLPSRTGGISILGSPLSSAPCPSGGG